MWVNGVIVVWRGWRYWNWEKVVGREFGFGFGCYGIILNWIMG